MLFTFVEVETMEFVGPLDMLYGSDHLLEKFLEVVLFMLKETDCQLAGAADHEMILISMN